MKHYIIDSKTKERREATPLESKELNLISGSGSLSDFSTQELKEMLKKSNSQNGGKRAAQKAKPIPATEPRSKVKTPEPTPEARKTIETPIVTPQNIIPMTKKELRFSEIILNANKTVGKGGQEIRAALTTITTEEKVLDIINPLFNSLVLKKAGATILTGLDIRKKYSIPVAAGNPAHWDEEEQGAVTIPSVELEPHQLTAQFEVSSMLLQQTEGSIENYLTEMTAQAMAEAIEKAVLGSTESVNYPAGIFFESSDLVATHAGMCDMLHTVESANSVASSFILNPDIAKTLRTTEKVGGYVMQDGKINGVPALVSNSAAGICCGGFKDLVVGLYSDLWVVSDPYTKAVEAITIVTITFDAAAHLLRESIATAV